MYALYRLLSDTKNVITVSCVCVAVITGDTDALQSRRRGYLVLALSRVVLGNTTVIPQHTAVLISTPLVPWSSRYFLVQ